LPKEYAFLGVDKMKLNRITLFKNGVGLFEGEAAVKDHRFSMELKKGILG